MNQVILSKSEFSTVFIEPVEPVVECSNRKLYLKSKPTCKGKILFGKI